MNGFGHGFAGHLKSWDEAALVLLGHKLWMAHRLSFGMVFVEGCLLFRRNSRRWRRFTGWYGRPYGTGNRSRLLTSEGRDCFVRIDWAGMRRDNCVWSATNMVARAKADFNPWDRLPTGAV